MSDRNYLAHRMNVLRTLSGSPHEPFARDSRFVLRPVVGYVGHKYQQFSGHCVFEIITKTGGERNLIEGVSRKVVIAFIDGCIMALEGRVRRYGSVS